jgi:hypothetical protein
MKFTHEQDAVLTDAFKTWGYDSQLQMAFGECGEFIALAGRIKQGRCSDNDMISEIADVTIMMRQIGKMLFNEERIQAMIDYKMARLANRLREHHEREIK